MGFLTWLVTFLILVSSAASKKVCDRCVHTSNATISNENYMKGTCQYGADNTEFNGAYPAGAKASIYLQGAGCGASYQVRCTNQNCNLKGIKVIVTSNASERNNDDFVLSKKAFKGLFKNNNTNLDKVAIEYKRVQSVYGEHQSMSIRVKHMGKNNSTIQILYQGGQTYIWSIEMAFKDSGKYWSRMNREEGTIWHVAETITINSTLSLRITVTEGLTETKQYVTGFVQIRKRRGVYGLRLQLNNKTAQEKCDVCDSSNWN